MSVRLPRLLDSNMNEVRRIRPLDGSLFLNIIPLSTASLTLETEQMIPVRSYVEMYNAYGSVGVFRVRTAGNTYGATSSTVELEHAICEVGDYICTTELNKSAPLNSAISELFAFYKGSKWRLGAISATDSVVVDISYDNVLEAILGLLEQAPEYMLTFDFSSRPWTINLARRGTTVSAEGRLGRNVQNASVSYDDSEVCTRAYIGWDNSKGKTTIIHYDADTMAQYGLIEKHLSGSGYTEDQARIVAQTYLKYHKKPKVAITITGYDFHDATGEPLDMLETGKLYRLALPKYGVTVEENITGLAWAHLYSEPDNVEITLADVEDPVVAFVRKTQKTGSGNSKAIVKKDKEYWTKFDQTDYYMDLMAVHVDKQGNILEQAGMYLDSQGVLIYADNNPNQVGARFKVQAEAINAEVRRATEAEGVLSGRLTVESNRITAEVTRATNAEGALSGRITVEADRITQEVTRATGAETTLSGRITVEAGRITQEVTDRTNADTTLDGKITVEAGRITQEVTRATTAEGTLSGRIDVTAEAITQEVTRATGAEGTLSGRITTEADRISLVVSGSGANASIKAAQIVTSINDSGSSVLLSADKIRLDGNTTVSGMLGVENGGLNIKGNAFINGTLTMASNKEIIAGAVRATSVRFPGANPGDDTTLAKADVAAMLVKAEVVDNVLTITDHSGNEVTFSKATSLSDGWSGNTYTVTATQNGVQVGSKSTSPIVQPVSSQGGSYVDLYVATSKATAPYYDTHGNVKKLYLVQSGLRVDLKDENSSSSGSVYAQTTIPNATVSGSWSGGTWTATSTHGGSDSVSPFVQPVSSQGGAYVDLYVATSKSSSPYYDTHGSVKKLYLVKSGQTVYLKSENSASSGTVYGQVSISVSDIGIYDTNSAIVTSQSITGSIDLWAGYKLNGDWVWGNKVTISNAYSSSISMRQQSGYAGATKMVMYYKDNNGNYQAAASGASMAWYYSATSMGNTGAYKTLHY